SLRIRHSIVGAIQVIADEFKTDPIVITIADSVVDATALDRVAIGSSTAGPAFATLTIVRTTVLGQVLAHSIDLGSNAIFAGDVQVARRQRGCIRYSFVPTGSRTPRRHRCQPDVAVAAIEPALTGQDRADEITRVVL